MQEYLQHIPLPPNKDTSDSTQNVITLAITDSDSTIVYYRIANGLLSPELETEAEAKANKRKRKRKKGGGGGNGGGDAKESKMEETAVVESEEEKRDPFAEEEL